MTLFFVVFFFFISLFGRRSNHRACHYSINLVLFLIRSDQTWLNSVQVYTSPFGPNFALIRHPLLIRTRHYVHTVSRVLRFWASGFGVQGFYGSRAFLDVHDR